MSQNTPETIVIRAEPIELSQLLKFAGIFGSGGEAKFAINSGEVTVNGAVELQARKKILGGQTVEIAGRTLLVKLGAASAVKVKKAPKPAAKAAPKAPATATVRPASGGGGSAKPAVSGGAQAWAGAPKGPRAGGQPGKPAVGGAFAKPVFAAAKPARASKPVRRDEDGYEDETPREKPAVSAAVQRTFFYTELLKAQQAKRKKR